MSEQTDAQRLEKLREEARSRGEHHITVETYLVEKVLRELDAANQTIADIQQAAQIMIDTRDKTILELQRQLMEENERVVIAQSTHGMLIRKVSELADQLGRSMNAYNSRVQRFIDVVQERDAYKAALECMSDTDHDDPHWYMELACSALVKHAPRQGDAK